MKSDVMTSEVMEKKQLCVRCVHLHVLYKGQMGKEDKQSQI